MQEAHNIDSALVKDMASRMNQQAPVQAAVEVSSPNEPEAMAEADVPHRTMDEPISAESEQPVAAAAQPESTPNTAQEEAKAAPDQAIDEYGNPMAKPKMYTEEEFNQRLNEGIRQRLARGKFAEQQPTQQQVKAAADEFTADPNSEETWETQLESFIEKTLEKRQAKQTEQQWREQENARQADFETKFNSGMSKYSDFDSVVQPMVSQQKITRDMMLAARNLDNPAAFIYGASKMHPQELDRISRIADPYAQAAEIGRLHEKMVKTKNIVSAAPRPLDSPRGDMPAKAMNMPSLEDRIAQHAKQKQARR